MALCGTIVTVYLWHESCLLVSYGTNLIVGQLLHESYWPASQPASQPAASKQASQPAARQPASQPASHPAKSNLARRTSESYDNWGSLSDAVTPIQDDPPTASPNTSQSSRHTNSQPKHLNQLFMKFEPVWGVVWVHLWKFRELTDLGAQTSTTARILGILVEQNRLIKKSVQFLVVWINICWTFVELHYSARWSNRFFNEVIHPLIVINWSINQALDYWIIDCVVRF